MLAALDANKDGKLTKDEMPGRIAERFDFVDQNHDGNIEQTGAGNAADDLPPASAVRQ